MLPRLTVVLVSLLVATPVVILWIWLLILSERVPKPCPEECSCYALDSYADCSYSGLNAIPSVLPTQVLRLVLDGNNITYFENDSFVSRELVELKVLDANLCNLRKIEFGAFNGLTNLANLSLKINEISEILPGTFEKISLLEYLHLDFNEIEHLDIGIFSGLVNLKYISLKRNKLQYLHPDAFVGLPNLQELHLSGNSHLQIPTDRHFINSNSLKQLNISQCNVCSVSVETFANISALEMLDMRFNVLKSLDINILKVLPKLSKLNLKRNMISEILPGTFEKISLLEYLHLGYNKIKHLDIDIFSGLVNLKYISLEGNILQYIHPDRFVGLPNLQELHLSANFHLQIPTDRHLINSHSLKQLDISSCFVRSLSVETFANINALERLDMGFNVLKSLDINILKVLPKLSKLNLEFNKISEILPGTFEIIILLEYLRLDYNEIEHLDIDIFSGLVNLKHISLKRNKLQYLHPDAFVGLQNLQELHLSGNFHLQIPTDRHLINSHSLKQLDISQCNVCSVSVETFANISALEVLDMRFNFLKSLDINILKVLPKLSKLNLKLNKISEILPGTFEKISLLEYLHLGYNKIKHLDIDIFSGLVNLKYISLEGNILQYIHPDRFEGLPNLQELNLSKNFDLQIPTDRHFINSHSLKHLDISHCNVSSVSVETFANVSALVELDLNYNSLRSVDTNMLKVLPKLSTFYLYGNPLECDCQLQEVWRWCQVHNIQTEYKETAPECDTPSEVKGIWWGVLGKGQCLQGNIQYYGDYKDTSYICTCIEDTDTETEKEDYIPNFPKPYELPISVFLLIFGTTGNVILITIITCNKDMRTVPNMYILNLAVSDIIHLTVLFSDICRIIFFSMETKYNIICSLHSFFFRMSIGLSAYSVAMLSIQRYSVTVNSLKFHVSSSSTWRVTGAKICGVWIVAALFAIPSARVGCISKKNLLLLFIKYYQPVTIYELMVFCVLPLCVIAFSYIMTARHLLESSRPISEGTQNPQLITRKNTAKIVLGLTVVFLISYFPNSITETYIFFKLNLEKSPAQLLGKTGWLRSLIEIEQILIFFHSFNPCLNPVALFCTSLAFRRHFKRYLTCCCQTNSPPTDFELRGRN